MNNTSSLSPRIVDQEAYEAAYRWLEKAIILEKDGKPSGLVNKALEKACVLEKEAFPEGFLI